MRCVKRQEAMHEALTYIYNDGGRAEAGRKGVVGDCVTRAIAIATGLPYEKVYQSIMRRSRKERTKDPSCPRSSARHGIYTNRAWFKRYMKELGFTWTRLPCGAKLDLQNLPHGRLVVSIRKHYTAVVDGCLHDIYDCSKQSVHGSTAYGYWCKESHETQKLPSHGEHRDREHGHDMG